MRSLDKLDLENLVRPRAAWSGDFHRVALALADKRPRERRGDGDAALFGVRLQVADNLIGAPFLGVLVAKRDGRPEFHRRTG